MTGILTLSKATFGFRYSLPHQPHDGANERGRGFVVPSFPSRLRVLQAPGPASIATGNVKSMSVQTTNNHHTNK